MVDALGLGPSAARHESSSLSLPTLCIDSQLTISTKKSAAGIDVLNTARIHRIFELERVDDEIENSVDGNHDKHACHSPHHVHLAITVGFPTLEFPKKLDNTDKEYKEAERENDRDNGIDHIRLDAVEKRYPCVCRIKRKHIARALGANYCTNRVSN